MPEVRLGNGELWLGEVLTGLVVGLGGAGAGAGAGGPLPGGPCLRGLNLYQSVRRTVSGMKRKIKVYYLPCYLYSFYAVMH